MHSFILESDTSTDKLFSFNEITYRPGLYRLCLKSGKKLLSDTFCYVLSGGVVLTIDQNTIYHCNDEQLKTYLSNNFTFERVEETLVLRLFN